MRGVPSVKENIELLDKMAREPSTRLLAAAAGEGSMRAKIAASLDKIEAARRNGWPLDDIARALGMEGESAARKLSAYLSAINKKRRPTPAKAAQAAPPPVPAQAPSQPAVGLPRPRLDVSQLPPPPGSRKAPETDFDRLKRKTDARLQEQIAAIQARSNQPKDVK